MLVNGVLTCSCLVLAATAAGQEITTVEGLGDGRDGLSVVQEAFVDEGAVQCGFCTPGLIVAVHDLLEADSDPQRRRYPRGPVGHLCRCTGYGRILAAVHSAAAVKRGQL